MINSNNNSTESSKSEIPQKISSDGVQIEFGEVIETPILEAFDGIRFDFNDGLRVFFPENSKSYRLKFIDLDNHFTIYDTITPAGECEFFARSKKKYYIRFRLLIIDIETEKCLFAHDYNAKGKNVIIRFPVHTLGDTIAWFSYVEKFQLKHSCNLFCVVSPWFAEIAKEQYPNIKFISKEEAKEIHSYANYNIGIWELGNVTHQPIDHRFIGLHKISAKILGVKEDECPPRFNLTSPRQIPEKYVCIAVQSTNLAKMWNNPLGWRSVVDFLKDKGYRVLCIDKDYFTGKAGSYTYMPSNAEDFTGNKTLQERIDLIKDADFFIGLSSGLSWLAWGCHVPIIMISGFTATWNEFYTPYRIINHNVCNSCWNDMANFNLANYWNCPRLQGDDRQFECSAQISAEKVIETIKKFIKEENK